MTRRAVLWRHGRTAWNAEQRFQGQIDVPLDDVGREQARSAVAALAALRPDLIVSSDLARAVQTATALADVTTGSVLTDPALREAHAGQWQGMTHAQIDAQDADGLAAWRRDPEVRPGGDGETRAEVAQRVVACMRQAVAELPDDGTAVFVTHGGAARAAVGELLGLPPAAWQRMGVLDNCAWAALHVDDDGAWRLERYNQAAALSGAAPSAGAVRESIV